jgi:succinate dehydrogenase / fumarate reductase cytochrome b subunit
MPFLVWVFGQSLKSLDSYNDIVRLLDTSIIVKLIIVGILWSIIHHMLAGIRFLVIDAGIGTNKQTSIKSSAVLLIISAIALLTLLAKAFL